MMTLAGFLLLFVASRLLYLELIDPSYLLPYPLEELDRGVIAQELITGLKMPFTEYRADNYSGGSLVIGALAAGFFLLFGPTVLALKLAPLVFFTLSLAFWYWTIQRAVGERVAGYFAMLFCFSPPLFTDYSVMAMGFHSESILYSALTVFLFFRMLSDDAGSPAYPALLGLTAGFGLWFAYIYGLTLLAMLGFWLWHDKGVLQRWRVLCFALGFVVGFSPWILINVQNHFAGLVIYDKNVWEHFGLAHLWEGLSHPRELALYRFFADIASNDAWDLYRRATNLLYSLLYLGPILTAGFLRLKTERSAPTEANYSGRGPRETRPSRTHPTRPTFVGFSILYAVVFALAVQLSDFREARYHVPVYPFLFLFAAVALARCQETFPLAQRKIQTIFLASVVVLGMGTHAPLLSLDRAGFALSAKGYSYAMMPWTYLDTHAPAGPRDREAVLDVMKRPFLTDILPKLPADDQRHLARAIVRLLADVAPLNGQAEDFAQLERLLPPGFDTHFYYQVGVMAMDRHPNEFPKAIAAVAFVRHRSSVMHHLALVGIYRWWPWVTALDRAPEALVNTPAVMAPEVLPHYWRALGHYAGRYWYDNERSLSLLIARMQSLVPRLDPSVQRSFLQGVGEWLFAHFIHTHGVAPAELERFPQAYQEGLMGGWGTALGEYELHWGFPWHGQESPYWTAWTKGLSVKSLSYVQQGNAQFEALFEGATLNAPAPPRQAP
jgi:hypothetical protein